MGSITVDENDLDFRSATPKRMTPSKTPLRSFLKSPKYFEDSENSLVIVGSLTSSNRVCSEQVKQIGFQNLKEQKNLSIETQEEFKIEEENSLVKSN